MHLAAALFQALGHDAGIIIFEQERVHRRLPPLAEALLVSEYQVRRQGDELSLQERVRSFLAEVPQVLSRTSKARLGGDVMMGDYLEVGDEAFRRLDCDRLTEPRHLALPFRA